MKRSKIQPSPLIMPVIFWISGIILGKQFQVPGGYIFLIIILMLILSFIKKIRIYMILLSILFSGFLNVSIRADFPSNHIYLIVKKNSQFTQPIEGKIVSEVKEKDGFYRFILELNTINKKRVIGRINFTTRQDSLSYGNIISTIATINMIKKPSNPFGFDYEEYSMSKRIYASAYALTVINIIGNKSNPLRKFVIDCRKFIRARINNRFGKHSGFVKAIVIGDKTGLDMKREILTKAGLSHLLAVSGLHVGILSLVFYFIIKLIIPFRNIARFVLINVLLFYAAICSWSPSVTRAVIMISLYLISKIIQRKADSNNILVASLLFITFFEPEQLFSIGLQMSFTAVLVLLNIIPRLSKVTSHLGKVKIFSFGRLFLKWLILLLLISFILSIFLSPITLLYFNQFNLNGIVGNLLGIPLISLLLPLGIVIIFLPEIGFLISLYKNSFDFLMIIFDRWTEFASKLPLYWKFIPFNLIQVILAYLFLYLLVYMAVKFKKKKNLIFIVLILLVIQAILFEKSISKNLKIIFFDCGLGDLALIETPDRKTILIDSGPIKSAPKHFRRSALPYFQKNGISVLDWVIITHAHNDHYGGLDCVLEEFEVKNLVVTDEFQARKVWKYYQKRIEEEKCKIVTISDTTHIPNEFIKIKILHPDKLYADENINNMSIVIRIDYKDFSVIFNGDLEDEGEHYLLENYYEFLDCDVTKVGHHGSKTSSIPEYIEAVSPDYAFIPTSLKNRFNFPHKTTLEKYSYLGENLFIAGKDGALQIETNGITAELKTFLTNKIIVENKLK